MHLSEFLNTSSVLRNTEYKKDEILLIIIGPTPGALGMLRGSYITISDLKL